MILSVWAKQNFLCLFKNKIIDNFIIFVATKNGGTKRSFSPSSFGYWIRDPKSGIQDE
jgi:hypothetical protein